MIKKIRKCDDRPSRALATRNQVAQANRNEVNVGGESEAERKLREVLDKLSRIAHALAVKFHWQENLVFADLVSDLRILADPSKIAELEDNPINQMTREIMAQFLGSPEDFDVFRNQAVDQIMDMSEQEAVRRIGMYVNQGLIGNAERYIQIENAPQQAQLEVHSEDSINDTPNEEAFKEKFGENNLNRFKRLKQKMTAPDNDITAWTAHGTVEELNEYLNEVEYYGAPIEAENEMYVAINVTTRELGQRLGSNAWCVFKPAGWAEYEPYMRKGLRYDVFLNKYDPEEKYCVVSIFGSSEIVDINDTEKASLPAECPIVEGVSARSAVVEEDMSSNEATLKMLDNWLEISTDEQIQTAFEELFEEDNEDIYDYYEEELREKVSTKIHSMNTNELKTYVEEHYSMFSKVDPNQEEVPEEIEYDEEDYNDEDVDDDYDDDDEWNENDIEEEMNLN